MFVFVILAALGLLASCGTQSRPVDAFSIVNANGRTVRLGDSRSIVEKLLGPQEQVVTEFEEDGTERVQYLKTTDVLVDFNGGKLCAIRLENPEWKLASGFTIGSAEKDVLEVFDKNQALQYPGYNGLWMSIDSEGKQIDFDENSEYQLRFDFKKGQVVLIMLQNNVAPDRPWMN